MITSSRTFLDDVREQMDKVTWPDWPQLKNTTIVVLIFSVILALMIAGMDVVVRLVLDFVTGVFGG